MAVLANTNLTLADWAKRLDPDGSIPDIAEMLSQSNEILEDAVYRQGNLPTGHRVVIRTGLPAVYFRSINQGVPPSKSTTVQVDESVSIMEAYSRPDVDLVSLEDNEAAFLLSEASAFVEGMGQAQAYCMIYGNPVNDPRQYLGLSARYGAIAGAGNASNIIDAGGTATNNTSVWLVVWDDNTVFCPFPKGSVAGLKQADNGVLTVYDSLGNPYQAHQSHYQWKNGLVVKDWRYVVRICNINTANLVNQSAAADMVTLMSRALDRIPNLNKGKAAFYCNRTVYSMLRVQALNKSGNAMSIESGLNQFGMPSQWASFQGVPLRKADQLLNTESRVV